MRGPDGATAQCPGPMHNNGDRNPSLSLSRGRGLALINCWAGCEPKDVMAAMGKPMSDLFDNRRDMTWGYADLARNASTTPGRQKEIRAARHQQRNHGVLHDGTARTQLDLIKGPSPRAKRSCYAKARKTLTRS